MQLNTSMNSFEVAIHARLQHSHLVCELQMHLLLVSDLKELERNVFQVSFLPGG